MHEIERESYRLKPRRCDAHEPADLDIGIAKQSKQSKARPIKTWHDTSKHSKAKQGTTRHNMAARRELRQAVPGPDQSNADTGAPGSKGARSAA